MKILISGGTGFVGRKLVDLLSPNHSLFVLTRNIEKVKNLFGDKVTPILWEDFNTTFDLKEFGKMDAAINLIGENIGEKKWSNEQKKILYNSRVDATKSILNSLKNNQESIEQFISTSAVGIYTNGFLKKLCLAWEESVKTQAHDFADQYCILRVGMVLGKGGAMKKMLTPFRAGLGGKIGSGSQWMSWVHIDDLVNMYKSALEDKKFKGTIDAVSPFAIQNIEFTEVLGKTLRKKTPFAVPSFALKLALGEMSCLMLDSIKVEPKELKENNFHYLYPTIELALKEVVSRG